MSHSADITQLNSSRAQVLIQDRDPKNRAHDLPPIQPYRWIVFFSSSISPPFRYLGLTAVWKQMVLLLMECQEVNSSLTVCHGAQVMLVHLITEAFMASAHHKKCEDSTVRCLEGERPRSHYFVRAYCYNCPILPSVVVNPFLWLTYQLNFIIGHIII